MTPFGRLLFALTALVLAGACTDEDRYPMSGQECTPGDPVQGVDATATNCIPTS
jgi:hypothetical protein